jgi:cob(I)alamin adenosyltransferase
MKIYTKTGDKGQTSLLSGERADKNNIRIETYGTIDELNSFIGLLMCEIQDYSLLELLKKTQNNLFNIGSLFATEGEVKFVLPQTRESDITELELSIDEMNKTLPPLKNFILPGGTRAVSLAHVCRTVCRRAERCAVAIPERQPKDEIGIQYLNRLSDYFFVLARYLGFLENISEHAWQK